MGAAPKTFLAPQQAVTAQFRKLAKAIGQIYATMSDAISGKYPTWKPNGLPIYPIIVTLDNWNLFTPMIQGELDNLVKEELNRRGIGCSILSDYRYTVCCIREFEAAIQVMHSNGIHEVMKGITDPSKAGWLFSVYLTSEFSESTSQTRALFPEERERFLSGVLT